MKRSLHLSAKQTAGLCVLGGLIAAIGFLFAIPEHATHAHLPHSALTTLWAAAMFATVALGIALSLFANSSLGNGIAAARWSDQETESLRTILNSRPFNILYIALLAILVTSLIMGILSPHLYPIYWACFILSQSILWLRNSTRRQASKADPQSKWSNLSPLHSDHWGQH